MIVDGTSRPTVNDRRALEVVGRLRRFRCAGCGYGASCRAAPERCPMCGSRGWEHEYPSRLAHRDQPVRHERPSLT